MRKGWEIKTVGDVCKSASSNVSQNSLDTNIGEYPIYGASGLIKKVNFYHRDKPYLSIVKDGSGFGRITIMSAYTSVIGTLQYIIPNEEIDLNYLYYNLLSIDLIINAPFLSKLTISSSRRYTTFFVYSIIGEASEARKYSPLSPKPKTRGLPFLAAIICSGFSLSKITMA